jgi:hypothetical protein
MYFSQFLSLQLSCPHSAKFSEYGQYQLNTDITNVFVIGSELRHYCDVQTFDLQETRDRRPALSATKQRRVTRAYVETNDIRILSNKKQRKCAEYETF